MPASIIDPFVVTSLPRLPPTKRYADQCKIARVSSPSSRTFDMSVNGSYIGSYVIKPSPRVTWSYALSPFTEVVALDSYEDGQESSKFDDEDDSSSKVHRRKLYVASLNERGKNSIRFIECPDFSETEGGQEPNVSEVKTDCKTVGLRLSDDGARLYTINLQGTVRVGFVEDFIKKDDKEPAKPAHEWKKTENLDAKVVFQQFISIKDFHMGVNGGNKNQRLDKDGRYDTILVFVEQNAGESSLKSHIMALGSGGVLEIATATITEPSETIKNGEFVISVDCLGQLALLEGGERMKLHIYNLPYMEKVNEVDLGWLFKDVDPKEEASMLSIATSRVLVAKSNLIALVDVQFKAALATWSIPQRVKEGKPPKKISLMQCAYVKGSGVKTRETFALFLVGKGDEKVPVLDYASIDVGMGKLRDVLGHGLRKFQPQKTPKPKRFVGLPLLMTRSDFKSVMKESAALVNRSGEASNKMERIYQQLKGLLQKKKYDDLEGYIVSFLKMDQAAAAGKGLQNSKGSEGEEEDNLRVYEAETDRIVDSKFIRKVTLLLFDQTDGKISLRKDFIPERALTYLLTHPLFPSSLTSGLLEVLASAPRLMRQAIVTCPNIPCQDLVKELDLVEDMEVFKDVTARLIYEFSPETITEQTISLIRGDSTSLDLDKIIQRVLDTNCGYELLDSFIDSNGLVMSLQYNKSAKSIEALDQKIGKKVSECEDNVELLSVVTQALSMASNENSKRNRMMSKRERRKLAASAKEKMGPFESMLQLNRMDTKDRRSRAKQIPAYSVERLTI